MYSNLHAAQTVILAFQHYIVMLGSTVTIATMLVPRMGGGPVRILIYICIVIVKLMHCLIPFLLHQGDKARVIQSLLFMSGINTLLQTFLGTRLPTVMGPSFAYIISVLGIINDFSDSNFSSEHEVCKICQLSEVR